MKENKKDNKKNNKKVLVLVLIIIAILVAISGVAILQLQNSKKEEILKKLSIDNYLKLALNSDIKINENILDVNSNENMMLYFYGSNTLKHYRIHFMDYEKDGTPINFVYARYDTYQKEHQKVFGVKPNLELDDTDLQMANVVQVKGDDYRANSSVGRCDEKTDPKECYIMLKKYSKNTNTITFSELSMKNNVISGNAKVESKDNKTLDATFELEYKENNDNYMIKSLKIKSINN